MVDNAKFHIAILVADGALSNVLIKKYEALLLQLQLHVQSPTPTYTIFVQTATDISIQVVKRSSAKTLV